MRTWNSLNGRAIFCRLHPTYHKDGAFVTPWGTVIRREVSGKVMKVITRADGSLKHLVLRRWNGQRMRIYEPEVSQVEVRALAGNTLVGIRSFKNHQQDRLRRERD